MEANYQVDSLDRKILQKLLLDARKPFTEVAKELIVSTGTVHQRVERMKEAGVIQGFHTKLDYARMGKPIVALVGIHLNHAKYCTQVYNALGKLKEVVEVHFTTGTYALVIKVVSESIPEFHRFLTEELQTLKPIRATETFFCLSSPIERPVDPS